MPHRRVLTFAGIGLIGAGVVMAMSNSHASSSSPPPPGTKPPPQSGAGHQSIGQWIAANRNRADIVSAKAGRLWEIIMQAFLTEQWSDVLARPDIAGGLKFGAWSEVEGQWISEHASAFWSRADIKAEWPRIPAGVLGINPANGIKVFSDTRSKENVVGEFLKENGL